jgi:hypothetical protein
MVVVTQFIFFALLNVKASAFQQSETASLPETRASQFKPQDSYDLQVETQSSFTSRFDGMFKDVDKETKKVRFGSLSVTTNVENTKISLNPFNEALQDQTIAFDLTDFRGKTANIPAAISTLSPSSIYVSTFAKETPYQSLAEISPAYQSLPEISPARTQGIGAGASWWWKGGNGNVSYFNYSSNSSTDGQLYKSTGSGAFANFSASAGPIGFYAQVRYCYSEDLIGFSSSVSRGYDAYVLSSYKQRYLPDITLEGSFGRHQYNSVGWMNDTSYWSGTLGFDVSKYLWGQVDAKSKLPTAKLFYRYLNYTDHSVVDAAPTGSQFVGLMVRAGL